MEHILIAVSAIGGLILGLPLAAAALVSLASKREESAHSLSRRPRGLVERLARRLLGVHPDGVYRSASKAEAEVRFAHARRAVPAPRQFPPGDEPFPGQGRADDREPAGV
jgi:hypothetical protein